MKLLVCISALVAAAAASDALSTMPLFTWTQSSSGSAPTSQPESVDTALASALSGAPEVVMVYMMHETSAQQMLDQKDAMTHLKDAVTSSVSSSYKALPLAKAQISHIMSTARTNGVNTVEVPSDKLQAFFEEHAEVLTNSKPDVVVVRFPEKESLASVDAIVGASQKAVSAVTNKVNSILSTTSSMETDSALNMMSFDASDGLWTRYPTVAQAQMGLPSTAYKVSGQPDSRHYVKYGPSYYLTPTLLLAIMVMIYAGVLLLTAFCCILSLQTPQKFEGDFVREMADALDGGNSQGR